MFYPGIVSNAKKRLSERLKRRLSFGDLFNEVFGRNIEFLDVDNDLLNYIKEFCRRMEEKEYVLGAMLFGSVAKGTYDKYSDIDILIVISDRKYAGKLMDQVHMVKRELEAELDSLLDKDLPTFISPVVMDEKALMGKLQPIYLDFLDYGIVLFEKREVLARFLKLMSGVKHWREFMPYEVLRWQA